ncbi:MAG: hypothetical protein R2843_05995 [Thermomicrobiales bacterium]
MSTSNFNYVTFQITENDAELLGDEAAILAETANGIRPIIAKTEVLTPSQGCAPSSNTRFAP